MRDRDEFERCAKFISEGCWSWFLTLKYPRVVSPTYPATRCESAEEAFKAWFWEVNCERSRGITVPYIRVIEQRKTGDILLHVLSNGIPRNLQRHWRYRWWELTSGRAWDRILDSRTEGLIRYLFYKRSCNVEFYTGREPVYCEACKADE